ncbi:MAG: hypothetical protein J6S85_14390 [Methanobrevibacter sp.]|nr:hypothetical protein [Methanobrevibacter sp.]
MEDARQLYKVLKNLQRENEILDLKIKIARAEKKKQENEAELERLEDPSEPAWRDECYSIPCC